MHQKILVGDGRRARLSLRHGSLIFLHVSFEFLDGLLVGVDEKIVIELELKFAAVYDSLVVVNIPLVAAKRIADVQYSGPHLTHLHAS